MPPRQTPFTIRFRRLAVELGYIQATGHTDHPKITELVRIRNRLKPGQWSDQRVYWLATGRVRPKIEDLVALAAGLEVEVWRLLYDARPRRGPRSVLEGMLS